MTASRTKAVDAGESRRVRTRPRAALLRDHWIIPDVFLRDGHLRNCNGPPAGGVVALLPEHGVFAIDGTDPGKGRARSWRGSLLETLATVFQRLWPKIPVTRRRKILRAWNTRHAVMGDYRVPQIAICSPEGWADLEKRADGSAGFWWRNPETRQAGSTVLLTVDIIRQSQGITSRRFRSNALLEFILAHELVHLTQSLPEHDSEPAVDRQPGKGAVARKSIEKELAYLLCPTEVEANRLAALWTGVPSADAFDLRGQGLNGTPAERRKVRMILEAAVRKSTNGPAVLEEFMTRREPVDIREILARLRFK